MNPSTEIIDVEIICEADEQWSFVGNKKRQHWLWYALDSKRKKYWLMFSAHVLMRHAVDYSIYYGISNADRSRLMIGEVMDVKYLYSFIV